MNNHHVVPSQSLLESMRRAQSLLERRNDSYFTGEHLLYGLLEDPSVLPLFDACEVDRQDLKRNLLEEISRLYDSLARPAGQRYSPQQTEVVHRAMTRGAQFAVSGGRREIEGIDVLLGLLDMEESVAVFLLNERGVNQLNAKRFVSHG